MQGVGFWNMYINKELEFYRVYSATFNINI